MYPIFGVKTGMWLTAPAFTTTGMVRTKVFTQPKPAGLLLRARYKPTEGHTVVQACAAIADTIQ